MAEHWTLRVRRGPSVVKERYGSLDDALDGLQAAVVSAGPQRLDTARALVREISPEAQVGLRAEIAGPQRFFAKVNGGVDLRGDGSALAYTGRVNRVPVECEAGESAVAALRRAFARRER